MIFFVAPAPVGAVHHIPEPNCQGFCSFLLLCLTLVTEVAVVEAAVAFAAATVVAEATISLDLAWSTSLGN